MGREQGDERLGPWRRPRKTQGRDRRKGTKAREPETRGRDEHWGLARQRGLSPRGRAAEPGTAERSVLSPTTPDRGPGPARHLLPTSMTLRDTESKDMPWARKLEASSPWVQTREAGDQP